MVLVLLLSQINRITKTVALQP